MSKNLKSYFNFIKLCFNFIFNFIKLHFNFIKYFLFSLYFFILVGSCSNRHNSGKINHIVSLSPSLTQIVFALGEGKKVVAVTKYDFYPPETKKLPKVGGFLDVSLEKIISYQPDLVLLSELHSDLAKKLKEIGIPYLELKTRNLSETFDTIKTIGEKLKITFKSEKLIKNLKKQLKAEKCPQKPRVLITLGHIKNSLKHLVAAGKGTYLDEILTLAGGINAIYGGVASYPSLSSEEIITLKPDMIIDIALNKSKKPWEHIKFVKKPEIYVFNDRKFSSPGIFFPFIFNKFHKVICNYGKSE